MLVLNKVKIHNTADLQLNNKAASKIPIIQAAPSARNLAGQPSSAAVSPTAHRSIVSLIAATGLPNDKLSLSIISFARFFSLPLKPEILTAIHRQAIAQEPSAGQSAAAAGKAVNEGNLRAAIAENTAERQITAKALAAAAAESKGVELNARGIETYSEAINPDGHQQQKDSNRQHKKHDRKKLGIDQKEEKTNEIISITAETIKEAALKSEENNALLSIMNRLPGKNGQMWIVLPFDFFENGKNFHVILKIMLEKAQAKNESNCVVLDITEKNQSGETERHWNFAITSKKFSLTNSSLAVSLQPELPPKMTALFAGELALFLDIPSEQISIKTKTGDFPFETNTGGAFPVIDEAV